MKGMKRSMFVTTILMVVLLIVALSTATFAWYTANTNVQATKTSVTSATSNNASLVIDTQVAGQNDTNSSVDLTLTGTNVPMVYTSDTAVSLSTTYDAFIANFKTFTRDAGGHFASAVTGADPAVLNSSTGVARTDSTGTASGVIVLTNVGGNSIATINTNVTIDPYYFYTRVTTNSEANFATYYTESAGVYTLASANSGVYDSSATYYTRGAANDHLRVAVFACPTNVVTGESGYTMGEQLVLKGIYGTGDAQRANATNLGSITQGVTDIATAVGNATLNSDLTIETVNYFKASGTNLPIATSVPAYGNAGNSIYVKVVVWFEGVDMNNADAGKTAAFTMSFSA